jgi:hypothetical protein
VVVASVVWPDTDGGDGAQHARRCIVCLPASSHRACAELGMRSLPEKTIEHWTGLYLSSRFVRAEQWWPTRGEDMALTLRSTITSPGKVILLEVKVPEVTPTGHTLSISVDQLRRYLRRRLPVFYVLPVPHWSGSLGPGASVPASPAGWWRRRSDPDWFGYWTYVLSAADIASQVNMAAANPVLYTTPAGRASASSLPKALRGALSWPDFWSEIQSCGPVGATRWRIREDPHGVLTVTDLASEDTVGVAVLQAVPQDGWRAVPRDGWRVEQGDNLVVLHIDEHELRV